MGGGHAVVDKIALKSKRMNEAGQLVPVLEEEEEHCGRRSERADGRADGTCRA